MKTLIHDGVLCISIHALRGEGDLSSMGLIKADRDISIHALRGEGDGFQLLYGGLSQISIHALRGEGDESSTASACI